MSASRAPHTDARQGTGRWGKRKLSGWDCVALAIGAVTLVALANHIYALLRVVVLAVVGFTLYALAAALTVAPFVLILGPLWWLVRKLSTLFRRE